MDEHRNVTDSEWKIMDQLWKNGEMTMTQITRALEEETGWSKHTVISLLKRMCQKGSAEIVPETSPMRYRALISRKDAVRQGRPAAWSTASSAGAAPCSSANWCSRMI